MKINKISFGLLLSAAALATSCDMDTTNFGVIDQSTYIKTMDDCKAYVNGIYTHMRSKTGGYYMFYADVQMDQFVGLNDNGNRGGIMSMGQGSSFAGDTDLANIYYNLYIMINDANYFLPRVEELIESPDFSDDDKALLKYYKGTALFARAYGYWYLFDHYVNYDPAALNVEGKGLQIQNEFVPSGDRGSYPGRSSIQASVDCMYNDLKASFDLLSDYEANVSAEYCVPNAIRLSSYTVAALHARVALLAQDYKTATEKAEYVINSGNYELTGIDDYPSMWINDEGSELLFVPYATKGVGGLGIAANYIRSNQFNQSDYIPTAETVLSYGDGDVRLDTFFQLFNPMEVGGEDYFAYAFVKYQGNPELNPASVNVLLNKSKPFRLSELYLIAAEAYAADGAVKNEAKANQYLNDLRAARIADYEPIEYNGSSLVNQIRAERGKELIGEGFRLSDLRRWGQGFTREAGWDMFASIPSLAPLSYIMDVIAPGTGEVQYQPNDYRFVWPIPTRELQVNPQLNGQQNPGY